MGLSVADLRFWAYGLGRFDACGADQISIAEEVEQRWP